MSGTKILIVEDDAKIRSGIRDNLEFDGFRVIETWNAKTASMKWRADKPDLVILDLMLPGKNGYSLLKEMRTAGYETPVIILSALGEEWNRIKGFRLGCDDYMVKPFSVIELIARINAVLRRTADHEEPVTVVELNGLRIDTFSRSAVNAGHEIVLSTLEFDLLAYFARNQGRVIPRKELLEQVWKSPMDVDTRTVDVHVSTLRRKIGGVPVNIETVYKAGYRLQKVDGGGEEYEAASRKLQAEAESIHSRKSR